MRYTLRPLASFLLFGALLLVLGAAPEPAADSKAATIEATAFAFLAAQPEPTTGSVPLPAGLSDHARRTGFFSNAAAGIDAVDLTTGELRWRNSEAQRPLLLDGHRLYAQAGTRRNRLRVLALDLTRKGECVFESDPVVFPGWVVTGEAPGRSFRAGWRLENNRLLLAWQAEAWSDGGGRSPGLAFPLRKHADGRVRIDLDSGQAEMLPAAPVGQVANLPNRNGRLATCATKAPPAVAKHLEKKALRWTARAGRYFLALELAAVDPNEELRQLVAAAKAGPAAKSKRARPESRLVLWAWASDSGLPALQQELLRGRRLMVQTTLDGRYLCLRDALPSPDEMVASQMRANGAWSVYSILGKSLGHFPYQPGTESLAVVGHRVYCLVGGPIRGPLDRPTERPRTLRVIDLKSGKTVSERPVAPRALVPPG
jgi:hypothetical protein